MRVQWTPKLPIITIGSAAKKSKNIIEGFGNFDLIIISSDGSLLTKTFPANISIIERTAFV